ncbi:MAG TPA: efflux transporter outer membrane subunit [Allosphingosinicella sp.]|nr:efflux transporter outer membrane subunit [Allosphingosinicella sp.]
MRRFAVLASLAALSACTVGPNYRPPASSSLQVPDTYYQRDAQAAPANLAAWWEQFDDPLLTRLIGEASAANLDLALASSRLTQARESLVQARAGLVPTVGASGSAGRSVGDGNDRSTFSIGADASWEIDLFGRIRRGIEAANADAEGVYYDREALRVAIAGELATNYIQARLTQERLALARESLAIADDNLQIAQWRVQAGLASSLDSEQARAARAQTAATIPSLEQDFASSTYRIAVLTGRAPGTLTAELGEAKPVPRGPREVAAGIPADTLRQRPDIRSAERSLAAATARIGVAEAQLYPGLRLSGSIGTSAFSLGGLFSAITGSILGGIDQVLFDGGRLRSQVRAQQAATEGALATYRQSILTALEDVENALAALNAARRRQVEFTTALDAANNSAILARIQYRSGLTSFDQLLDVERSLVSARDGLASSRADESLALVQLYRAMGGGWDATAAPDLGTTR